LIGSARIRSIKSCENADFVTVLCYANGVWRRRRLGQPKSEHRAQRDNDELSIDGRQNAEYRDCDERDGSTALIRTQASCHIANFLSDNSDELQTIYQASTGRQ
jgi:hypothetical protein